MRSLFLLLLLPVLPVFLRAQQKLASYRLIARIEADVRFFTTDKLQQLYVITPANEVIKYDPAGRELFRYNNNTLGKLASIDATNPFNLLLFYPEFQTALTLDRTLNKIDEFNLWDNYDLVEVRAVAMANDNSVWLYDGALYRLKLIDQSGRQLRESDNLSLLLSDTPAPNSLLARDNLVFANDPALGMLVFDNFGQYVRTIPITGILEFQILDQHLIYRKENGFFITDLLALKEISLPLPPGVDAPRQVRLQKDRLYVLREKGGVEIYGVTHE